MNGGGVMASTGVDVAVMGGAGRVGLPLGIAFAKSGSIVVLYDRDESAVATINDGLMPFREHGAEPVLREVLASGTLAATTDPSSLGSSDAVVVVIGTPVDAHLNPDPWSVRSSLEEVSGHLRDGQLLVLRSTLFPGSTALIEQLVSDNNLEIDVVFCPERISEGNAMAELFELPQIVGARTHRSKKRAEELFRRLTPEIVHLTPEEAELAKLFTNAWRYIKFATANQLYMIANNYGLDYERIRQGLTHGYERAKDLPRAGLTAGPGLFKDTIQLAAFNDNNFTLGNAAMMVNEGLPLYIVSRVERSIDLGSKTVGILGMAFKAESDDIRSSLSYKLKRILRYRARRVLTTDPYVTVDPELVPLHAVLAESDLLIVGAPHSVYAELKPNQPVIDIWNLMARGVRA
jgi:UDP-N-acetyl-D-mannosaminuronic acid dehydrogenase